MPSCFITGLHVYDNRGLCACGEKGRPWTSRQEVRKDAGAMTTDNRTNEQLSGNTGQFTEAQVEAAAKAMWDLRKVPSDPEWAELEYGVKQEYRKDARAALVAAQGAARPVNGFDTTAERVKNVDDPLHAAPVLPSNGVDEVAREFRFTDAQWREYQSIPEQGYSHRHHLEHVFNAWLKEQGL